MTNKELITHLLNFSMDANVVFLDNNDVLHGITSNPMEYHGNGNIDRETNQIILISTKPKTHEK